MEFWRDVTVHRGVPFLLLNTTRVYSYGDFANARTIIPILTHNLGHIPSHNLFVVDINESALSRILIQNKFSEGSHFYVSDRYGNILTTSNRDNPSFPFDDLSILDIPCGTTYIFIEGSGRNAVLNIIHPSVLMNRSFVYISRTPMADIYSKSSTLRVYTQVVGSFTFIISLGIAFLMAKRLYVPIANVVREKDDLKSEFTKALPLILEQYLLKILSNNELFDKSESEDLVNKANISFKHPCFAVAIVIQDYTDKFFADFTSREQQLIYNTLLEIIRNLEDLAFQIFVLALNQQRLCVIVNLPADGATDIMMRLMNGFHDLLNFDEQYLTLYTGIGQAHEDFDGIYSSYEEANAVVGTLSRYSDEKIKVYAPDNAPICCFSFDEESKLYNYLAGGYHEYAIEVLKIVIGRNVANNIPEPYMKELLARLYMIGEKVLNSRGTSPEELMSDCAGHFLQNYSNLPYHDLVSYVTKLYARITEGTAKLGSKINCEFVRSYIETHFHEDIYLEKLADMYQVSFSYLSRTFKEHYGTTFQHYLANTRINHAKHLLATTNKTINEISASAGFNSRNTFIRMFKKLEGVTPTEFRINGGMTK